MLSKSDKNMHDAVYVQNVLKDVYTVQRFGSVKSAQYEAYDCLRKRVTGRKLTLRRVRTFFEGKARKVREEEKQAVQAARLEEALRERTSLRTRLDQLDALLAAVDAEFHGPTLEALLDQMREKGGSRADQRQAPAQRSASAGSSSGLD